MQTAAALPYEFLQQTVHNVRTLQKAIRPIDPPFAPIIPRHTPFTRPDLRLPEPIEFEIHDSNTPSDLRRTLERTISKLQTEYYNAFEDAAHKCLSVPQPQLSSVSRFGSFLQDLFHKQGLPDVMSRYTAAKEARADRIAQEQEYRRLAEEQARPQFNAVCPALRIPPYPLLTRLLRTTHLSSQ